MMNLNIMKTEMRMKLVMKIWISLHCLAGIQAHVLLYKSCINVKIS